MCSQSYCVFCAACTAVLHLEPVLLCVTRSPFSYCDCLKVESCSVHTSAVDYDL